MRLLIVDDEESIALGIEHIVRHMDTPFDQVRVAFSGNEALRALEETPCDLMLVDVSMPGMTGIELMRRAKERGLCARFGILSGYAEFQYAREAMDLGCMKYLLKPVDRGELKRFLLEGAQLAEKDRLEAGRAAQTDEGTYAGRMIATVERRFRENLTLEDVAREVAVSPDYAGRLFKKETGYGFHEYLNRYRVERIAERMLAERDSSVESLALGMGFGNVRSFHRSFAKYMGMTPGKYKKQNKARSGK